MVDVARPSVTAGCELRRAELSRQLAQSGIDAALVSHSRDVYYYAGTAQPVNLLVFDGHDAVVFARRAVSMVIDDVGDLEVRADPSFSAVARALVAACGPAGVLGVALDVVPAGHVARLGELLPDWRLVDLSRAILAQRAVKDASEIDAVAHAAELASTVDETIRAVLRPGLAPVALMAEVGRRLRLAGAEEILFFRRWNAWLPMSGICASGPEAAIISGHAMTVTGLGLSTALPWGPSRRPIASGEPIYVDLGLNLGGYHGDFTRTYVLGSASDDVHALYAAAFALQDAAFDALSPGAPAKGAMLAARDAIDSLRHSRHFQGHGEQQGDYIGHGLGLELDELPVLTSTDETLLRQGMCLAVEAKLIVPGLGAVGVEDTVVLDDGGLRRLTPLSRELVEL